MYEYRYSVGRYRDYQPGYHLVDISEYKLSDVAKVFNLLDIVVYDTFYKRLVRITLDDHFDNFIKFPRTIVDFLAENGSNVLKYYTDIPKNEYQKARWESIYHKAFYIHPGNVNLANDRQSKLTADAAPDIRIIRDGYVYKDYKKLADYSLCIVNGCFVRCYGNSDALYLLGAGRDYQAVKSDVYASVINFEKIGKITTIPIDKAMINRIQKDGCNRFMINLDRNQVLSGKTIWLVFNGQLCVDEEVITHIGGNVLQFRPEYIDMMTHYLTYKQYTRTAAWVDQSKRDKYVEESLVMENSFVVIIDNPTVGVSVDPLPTYPWPSAATSEESFQYPIMLENGLFPYVYRRKYGFNGRLINFDIHHQYKPVIDSVGNLSDNLVYDTSNQGMMGELPSAYEFKITGISYE